VQAPVVGRQAREDGDAAGRAVAPLQAADDAAERRDDELPRLQVGLDEQARAPADEVRTDGEVRPGHGGAQQQSVDEDQLGHDVAPEAHAHHPANSLQQVATEF